MVVEEKKISKKDINNIIKYIESLNKKRMLVEDIQDIIEKKLMEFKKFELAKIYIIYRYTRALVRKSNLTDETILGIIKNNNKNIYEDSLIKNKNSVITQRDLIAGEVSKDLTKRILLPEKIREAHESGILYFHKMEYFIQPLLNSSFIKMEDMLDNGTSLNEIIVNPPQNFLLACLELIQILFEVQGGQYGEISFKISCLGKYLKKSLDEIKHTLKKNTNLEKEELQKLIDLRLQEELELGIKFINSSLNNIVTVNGRNSKINLILNVDNNYKKETTMIIEEILKIVTNDYPNIIYIVSENNNILNNMALEISKKRDGISLLDENKLNNLKEGYFNQGMVSINLPQIAIESRKNRQKFFELLEERLDLCYEALMFRHHSLLGTYASILPIHFRYGAIARMNEEDKIDKYLKKGYSSVSLGYTGIKEVEKFFNEDNFIYEVEKYLNERIKRFNEETDIEFKLVLLNSKKIGNIFLNIDKEKYGIIKDITDQEYYSNLNNNKNILDDILDIKNN